MPVSYLWHDSLSLESSPDPVVDTLRLPPCGWNAFEAVRLVAQEVRAACIMVLVQCLHNYAMSGVPLVALRIEYRATSKRTLLDNWDVLLCDSHL